MWSGNYILLWGEETNVHMGDSKRGKQHLWGCRNWKTHLLAFRYGWMRDCQPETTGWWTKWRSLNLLFYFLQVNEQCVISKMKSNEMLTRAERDSQFLLFNTCLGKSALKARDMVTLYCRSTSWWEWVLGKYLSCIRAMQRDGCRQEGTPGPTTSFPAKLSTHLTPFLPLKLLPVLSSAKVKQGRC